MTVTNNKSRPKFASGLGNAETASRLDDMNSEWGGESQLENKAFTVGPGNKKNLGH